MKASDIQDIVMGPTDNSKPIGCLTIDIFMVNRDTARLTLMDGEKPLINLIMSPDMIKEMAENLMKAYDEIRRQQDETDKDPNGNDDQTA
jgi:hypothetical protein